MQRVAAPLPAAGLLLAVVASPAATAQATWEYTALADSSAELASFSIPAYNEAGQAAFVATFDDVAEGQALYRYDGPGVLTVIATTGNGIDAFLGNPAINAAGVVTVAARLGDDSTSIVTGSGGALATVANTAVDGLSAIDSKPFISDSGNAVVVRAVRASDGARVILKGAGAAAPAVLLASTGSYDPVDVAGINASGVVAFEALTDAGATRGIYRTTDGTTVTPVAEVANSGAEDLQPLDLNNSGAVTWLARDALADRLFTDASGVPLSFANTTGAFVSFGPLARAETGAVAFRGVLELGLDAVFAGSTSDYARATAVGDLLLGAAITTLDIGPQAVTASGAFVFRASRTNGTSGIYVAVRAPVDDGGGGSAVDPATGILLLLLAATRRRP
jgi:hypothetical protein